MTHGFNLESPLVCEGIIGDGCGGGRVFFIENSILKTFDPKSKEILSLLEDVIDVKQISKKGCSIFMECSDEIIEFNLSSLKKV